MIKKIIYITLILSILIATFSINFSLSTSDILAEGAILIDANTGQILYDKNMHTPFKPASTTKVLTALLILEKFALDEKVVIDKDSPFTSGSRIYIIEGEIFTIEQLLNAMLVESANDVAVALAIHHSGSVEAFASAMNAKAKELGALNSNFENPSGLDGKNHFSTAYDLALIGKAAMKNETLRSIVKKTSYQIPPSNKQDETRYLSNSNKFLYSNSNINYKGKTIDIKYDIVTGIKTGYTTAAGQCFIASATKDGRDLIAVILKSQGKNIYIDTRSMLDYGFDEFSNINIAKLGDEITTLTIEDKEVQAVLKEDISLLMPLDYDKNLLEKTIIPSETLALPITADTVLASVEFTYKDKILATKKLYAPFEMSDKELLTAKTQIIENKAFEFTTLSILLFIIKIIFAVIIWRVIMTFINIVKIKSNKR